MIHLLNIAYKIPYIVRLLNLLWKVKNPYPEGRALACCPQRGTNRKPKIRNGRILFKFHGEQIFVQKGPSVFSIEWYYLI